MPATRRGRKTYRYNLALGPVASPFTRRYTWHVPEPVDLDAMRDAAARLLGRHDFAAFQAAGTDSGVNREDRALGGGRARIRRIPRAG